MDPTRRPSPSRFNHFLLPVSIDVNSLIRKSFQIYSKDYIINKWQNKLKLREVSINRRGKGSRRSRNYTRSVSYSNRITLLRVEKGARATRHAALAIVHEAKRTLASIRRALAATLIPARCRACIDKMNRLQQPLQGDRRDVYAIVFMTLADKRAPTIASQLCA